MKNKPKKLRPFLTADGHRFKVGMGIYFLATADGGKVWLVYGPRHINTIARKQKLVRFDSSMWESPTMGDNRLFKSPTHALYEALKRTGARPGAAKRGAVKA